MLTLLYVLFLILNTAGILTMLFTRDPKGYRTGSTLLVLSMAVWTLHKEVSTPTTFVVDGVQIEAPSGSTLRVVNGTIQIDP